MNQGGLTLTIGHECLLFGFIKPEDSKQTQHQVWPHWQIALRKVGTPDRFGKGYHPAVQQTQMQ
jgi:hypothetical protein